MMKKKAGPKKGLAPGTLSGKTYPMTGYAQTVEPVKTILKCVNFDGSL